MDETRKPIEIGILVFPNVTQLDLTGPYEVLGRISDVRVHLLWKDTKPVASDRGLILTPTLAFANAGAMDVILVPGGPGVGPLMEDETVLAFLREQAETAGYVTSVCTGALVLGGQRGYCADIARQRIGRCFRCCQGWGRSHPAIGSCWTGTASRVVA